ncbi:MAG: UPF0262 family protein [Alphaproteobacteria bacterium]|jgi:uncharacterized protein (UPF0262 family)|nr:UPF0262 family protein [Alphaproteobacteria bacterium]
MSADPHRLHAVRLDEQSLAAASRDQEQERQIAIFDLLEDNRFVPAEAPEDGSAGPYTLEISLVDGRLGLDVSGAGFQRRHLLSLSPFRAVMRDYRMICESYYDAIRNATPSRIEALDMGRRGLHNEGSELLKARLEGKVEVDIDTARRLFTLICALHWRG